jgi:hypothetical protein
MPPSRTSHAVESLNTYFAALGISTRRVNDAIATVVADMLSERLELEIRTRLDTLTVTQLLEVLAAVSPAAAAESLPSLNTAPTSCCPYCQSPRVPGVVCCPLAADHDKLGRCYDCGGWLSRPPAPCPCRLPSVPERDQNVAPASEQAEKFPSGINPLCDLLPGGNKARSKSRRSK